MSDTTSPRQTKDKLIATLTDDLMTARATIAKLEASLHLYARPDVTTTVRVMSDFVNCYGYNPRDFAAQFGREHRTLQQSFTRVCLAWLRHLVTTPEHWFDLRNEASRKIAVELMRGQDVEYIDRLPLI